MTYVDHVPVIVGGRVEGLDAARHLYDVHVHVGPAAVMGPLRDEHRKLPLATFSHLTFEELETWYGRLFSGKRIAGLIAFPFPLHEVDIEAANRYLLELMKREPRVKGFALRIRPTPVGRLPCWRRPWRRACDFRGSSRTSICWERAFSIRHVGVHPPGAAAADGP